MFTKSFIAAALISASLASTEIAQSCLTEHNHLIGLTAATDLPFTDYKFLANSEQYNTIYRMTRFILCNNSVNELVGMRSIVTRFNAADMTQLSIISMNKIGTLEGTGIMCNSMVLDAVNGEYLSEITFGYQLQGRIGYIKAVSSTGQTLSKGILRSTQTQQKMTPIGDKLILAFWGYENTRISSVGQVQVELDCIKGVTTVDSVEEAEVVTVDETTQPTSPETTQTTTEPTNTQTTPTTPTESSTVTPTEPTNTNTPTNQESTNQDSTQTEPTYNEPTQTTPTYTEPTHTTTPTYTETHTTTPTHIEPTHTSTTTHNQVHPTAPTYESFESTHLQDQTAQHSLVTTHTPAPAEQNNLLYFILGGCGGFILTVAIVVIAVCYKQKKACFKRFSDVNITQTMPIENFKGYQEESEKKGLSFKGRMPSMKRAASVKQNRADSELVNVQHHKLENVSGEIQDSERKGTFQIDDVVVNDLNLESAPQLTDDEAPSQFKKGSY